MRLALRKLGVIEDGTAGVQLDLLGNAMPQLPTLTEAEELEEAYRQQGRRIAYTKPMIAA